MGFIIGVATELDLRDKHGKLVASYDEVTYPRVPSSAYLLQKLTQAFDEAAIESATAGDLALFNISNNPQHLAILTDYDCSDSGKLLGLIHSDMRSRKVVEHRLDSTWKSRLFKVYKWLQ